MSNSGGSSTYISGSVTSPTHFHLCNGSCPCDILCHYHASWRSQGKLIHATQLDIIPIEIHTITWLKGVNIYVIKLHQKVIYFLRIRLFCFLYLYMYRFIDICICIDLRIAILVFMSFDGLLGKMFIC